MSDTPLLAARIGRFGRIPHAEARSGLKRSKLYELAKKHSGLFRKADAATIVDLEMLDEILAKLPVAELGAEEEPTADTKKTEMVP